MNVSRVNSYDDPRFSQTVLLQHGCFLIENEPYEVEIISGFEAIVRGRETEFFPFVIEEFRFFTPHITVFYDKDHHLIQEFPPVARFSVELSLIQPSQFYVDREKLEALTSFIHTKEDIVIQVMRSERGYISLDGHTRLFMAVQKGWETVLAVEDPAENVFTSYFVKEARKRGIHKPYDLTLLEHDEYEEKWNGFCDAFFAEEGDK